MTGTVDGGGGAAFRVRISSDNASDASDDDSLVFVDLDNRKRKGLSYAAPDPGESSDQNKRIKHESSEYSGFSSDPQQGASSAEEARELDTSFDSRCDTSAFSSGEEGFSQRPDPFTQRPDPFTQRPDPFNQRPDPFTQRPDPFTQRPDPFTQRPDPFTQRPDPFTQRPDPFTQRPDPFTQRPDPFTQHKPGAFKQSQNIREDSWSGERNLLQLQLGSFIRKEKLRLESESESIHSLSSGYHGVESVPGDRDSNNLSCSLSGFLRGSTSSAESSDNTGYYSSRTSSILSSVMRNNKKDEVRIDAEERASLTHMDEGVSWPSLSAAQQVLNSASVHQKFVLSSGRPSNVTAARKDSRVYTIDRDFDDYFAKLML